MGVRNVVTTIEREKRVGTGRFYLHLVYPRFILLLKHLVGGIYYVQQKDTKADADNA
jgi:hypothetical protein